MNQTITIMRTFQGTNMPCHGCNETIYGPRTEMQCLDDQGTFEASFCDGCIIKAAKRFILRTER